MSSIDTMVPPQALAVEKTIIGTLMSSPEALDQLKGHLEPIAFYGSNNRKIYAAMLKMSAEGQAIDIVTLSECLRSSGNVDESMDVYLAEVSESVGSVSAIQDYVKIVSEKAIFRNVIAKCNALTETCFNDAPSIESLITQIETLGTKICNDCDMVDIKRKKKGRIVLVKDIKEKVLQYHKSGFENVGITVSKDWPVFNKHLRIAKKIMNVFTGIPGHGKSEFLDAIMINLALEKGWRWAVFSPENYPWELYIQKLSEKLLGKKFFGETKDSELEYAVDWINEHFFMLEPDEDNLKIDSLLSLNVEAVTKYKVDGVVWDPWNEIDLDLKGGENETSYIGRTLGKIRRHARRHDYSMNIVAHPAKIQKDLKTSKYLVPRLYDINGSANWYNKTDNGITVYRNFDTGIIDVHVQKIKFKVHGEVGRVPFTYDKGSGKFLEVNTMEF
jgi:hypothetical protein